MKRVTFRILCFLLSATLTFTPATHARMNGSTPQAGLTATTSTPDSHGYITSVLFDGQLLSRGFVTNLAADPVMSWGAIFNETGTDTVDGELWFIVSKDDQFIYYHLTDEPSSGTGSAAYGGYTVKMKTVMTLQVYNFGSGGTVPIIGNTTDAFVVTTAELYVNSSFINYPRPRYRDPITGAIVSSDILIHLFNQVESYNLPLAASTGR